MGLKFWKAPNRKVYAVEKQDLQLERLKPVEQTREGNALGNGVIQELHLTYMTLRKCCIRIQKLCHPVRRDY